MNSNNISKQATYNNIGLVDSILFESGAKVVYTYAMTGEKLRVRHYAAPQSVVSPRAAGIGGALIPTRPGVPTISYDDEEYYGADLVKFSHVAGTDQQLPTYKYFFGNGYVAFNSIAAQPTYYYYTKDHLGNIRSVVKANADGTAEEVQHTAYYPFGGIIPDLSRGTEVQNRLYNGKELDHSNNLWWYDYGARQFIVDAPRFNGPDPMGEKYYPFNTFGYCTNNPIRFYDKDGCMIVYQEGNRQFIYFNKGFYNYENAEFNKSKKITNIPGKPVAPISKNMSNLLNALIKMEKSPNSQIQKVFKTVADINDIRNKHYIRQGRASESSSTRSLGNGRGTLTILNFEKDCKNKDFDKCGLTYYELVGHELKHAYDFQFNKESKRYEVLSGTRIGYDEISTTYFENLIRTEEGNACRTTYSGYNIYNTSIPLKYRQVTIWN